MSFIHRCVFEFDQPLRRRGGGLHVLHGRPRDEIPRLARGLGVDSVFVNRDYEPAAVARDDEVGERLRAGGIALRGFKDQVIFEVDEVLTGSGKPFSVFTPYKRAWLARLAPHHVAARAIRPRPGELAPGTPMPSRESLGFREAAVAIAPGMSGAHAAWDTFRGAIRSSTPPCASWRPVGPYTIVFAWWRPPSS